MNYSLTEISLLWCVNGACERGGAHLGLVLEALCVDEPLAAGSDDDGQLAPPIIGVAVHAVLLLHQRARVTQLRDH